MVAGVYLAAYPPVYAAVLKSVRDFRRKQEVIEAHAFVLVPTIEFVQLVPDRPEFGSPPAQIAALRALMIFGWLATIHRAAGINSRAIRSSITSSLYQLSFGAW